MSELAQLHREEGLLRLVLNRPEKRNALSLELLAALQARIDELAAMAAHADAPAVLMLEGAGSVFCAGMDLRAVLQDPDQPQQLLSAIAELTISLRMLPMVVIAKVHSAAIGGGCGLVAACDLAFTHPDAKLGFPEVDLGVCPAVVAPWLIERIGAGRARRVLLSGGILSGQDAWELGLVTQTTPKQELDAACQDVAQRLAAAGPLALIETKRLLNQLEKNRGVHDAVRKGAEISAAVVAGAEAQAMLSKIYQ